MHRAVFPILILATLAACQQKTQGDAVRQAYENKADQIDAQAKQQPTTVAKTIYRHQADAIREEGKDREKGIEGGTPSSSPSGVGSAAGANGAAAP